MANLPETASWDAGVYQLETTDPVLGGPNGKSNLPLKNLANRTAYLKAQVDSLSASKAPLASPAMTGAPTAPTAAADTNTTQIATTEFVKTAIASVISGGIATSVAGKTGAVTLAVGDVSGAAPLASPAFTGTPSAPTQSNTDNSTKLATTAFVKSVVAGINTGVTSVAGKTGAVTLAVGDVSGAAPLDSPALTGTPTAPTPTSGDSTTKIATTAFVSAAIVKAGGTTLTNAAPTAETVNATAAVGTANTAARADHRHAMPAEASTTASGFMSAADKLKLDGIQAGAQSNTVTSVAGKTGAVTLAVSDISGAAPLASPLLTGTPTAPTPTTGDNTNKVATTAFVAGAAAEMSPAGMVAHFARNSAPAGWLKANGAAVSRTTYAALFAAIGTTFGSGNGSTTFNLPDLCGEFIRGWDDGRGVDTGRVFGSVQTDELRSHTHTYTANPVGVYGGAEGGSRESNGNLSATTGVTGG
ncbi:phage tail protein, partial [Pseudomonas sp.]|uniref:phage tail protein n=1 Tax=Pseudomonas sp. TaxID=306 RepID=UPI00258DC7D3